MRRALTVAAIAVVAAAGLLALRSRSATVAEPGAAPMPFGSTPPPVQPAQPVRSEPTVPFRPVPSSADPLDCADCNVVLISIDTLRADHLGTHGYDRPTSQHIDRFASESLVFENAISQSAWTTPAHASMLTGLLPRDSGLLFFPRPGELSAGPLTLAERLSAERYLTASWNGGGYVNRSFGRGFATWESLDKRFPKNLDAAREWLTAHANERFFLFVHGYDVHKPYRCSKWNTFHRPQKAYRLSRNCMHGEPEHSIGDDELKYMLAMYDACIVGADQVVGGFLDFLRDTRLLENTLVIITSDHGEEFLEHGRCNHIYGLHRELVHVPLIVHLPSRVAKRIADPVAASMSLTPTILGMLGLAEGRDMTYDLRPVARGLGPHRAIVSETGSFEVPGGGAEPASKPRAAHAGDHPRELAYYVASVTTPEYRLIYEREKQRERWKLYDSREIAEQQDLARSRAALIPSLKKLLFPPRGRARTPALPSDDTKIDPATLQSLRALGYIQ